MRERKKSVEPFFLAAAGGIIETTLSRRMSKGPAMDDHGLAKLLVTLTSDNPSLPAPSCVPLSRVRTALLREEWTEAEERHKRNCPSCRGAEAQARAEIWHPPLMSLFRQARGLVEPTDADLAYHLQKDTCRRCHRLVAVFQADRLLGRLAAQIRQGLTAAATRLGQMLASGVVATFALPGGASAAEQQLAFEGGGYTATLFRGDPVRLRLEQRGSGAEPPRLQRLLLGNRKEFADRFVVLRPGKEPQTHSAEVRLERLPSEPAVLALYDTDAAVLDREDVPQLREGFTAAGKYDPLALPAWQSWAAQTLKLPGLDAGLRTGLEGLVRLAATPQKLSP
jgi:hypothetical protein